MIEHWGGEGKSVDVREIRVSSFDGMQLYTRHYRHPFARAVVVITHGYGEHSLRYEHVAAYLNEFEYAIVSFDLRAHGLSQGYPGYVAKHRQLVDDLSALVDFASDNYPDRPIFLLGHGSGATIASLYAAEKGGEPGRVQGLILSAPAIFPQWRSWDIGLSFCVGSLLPRLPLRRHTQVKLLSRNPDNLVRIGHDPLYHKGAVPARTSFEFARGAYRVRQRMAEIRIPTLMLQGTADRVSNPKNAELLFDIMPCSDKTYLSYDGYYHELFNEFGNRSVLKDIVEWLLQRTLALLR